jgi:predicted component of type VI protein secretion system
VSSIDENDSGGEERDTTAQFASQVKHLADILDLDDESIEDEAIELNDDELDLVYEDADGAGAILNIEFDGALYEVTSDRFIIGRAQCDLKIVDANVSRHHAAIDCVEGSYVIRDLGSTNGIEIDGEKVQEHRIKDGDLIVISGHELRCSFSPASSAPELVEVTPAPISTSPTAAITQRMETAPSTETVIAPEPALGDPDQEAFQERMEVRLDAMAQELTDLRDAVERMADQLENLTVEAMGRLLQGRVEQAKRKRQ